MRAMRLPAAVAACALLTTTGYAPHLPPEGQTTGQWPTVEQTTNVDDEDTRATEPDPPEEVVDAHMEALAAGSDPHRMREGLALVEEDSPAHDYLIHHIFLARAWYDQGDPLQDADVERTDRGAPTLPGRDRRRRTDARGLHRRRPRPGPARRHARERHRPGTRSGPRREGGDSTRRGPRGAPHRIPVTGRGHARDHRRIQHRRRCRTRPVRGFLHHRHGLEIDADPAVGRYELDAATATRTAFSFPSAEPGGELHVGGCLSECSSLVDVTLPVNG